MKIEGPNRSSGTKGASRTDNKKSGDGAFGSLLADESSETGGEKPIAGAINVGGLSALLSLQEADESTSEEAKRKAKKRATAMLDELDKIRQGILMGGIPAETLKHLSHMIAVQRDAQLDPRMQEVLDEIDLRVQVELAKHG